MSLCSPQFLIGILHSTIFINRINLISIQTYTICVQFFSVGHSFKIFEYFSKTENARTSDVSDATEFSKINKNKQKLHLEQFL